MKNSSFIPGYDEHCLAEAWRMAPILDRYDTILAAHAKHPRQEDDPGTAPHHLRWMISVMQGNTIAEGNGKLTPLKMHRWLGFIQGTMIAQGLLTVPQERALTRGILTEH